MIDVIINAPSYLRRICNFAIVAGNFFVKSGSTVLSWLEGVSSYTQATPKAPYNREKNQETINIQNEWIHEQEKKQRQDGDLSQRESEELENARKLRFDAIKLRHQERIDRELREAASKPESIESYPIAKDQTHIWESKVGLPTAGKLCPECGESMILQWKKADGNNSVQSFFWACPGYYKGECRFTQSWKPSDECLIEKAGFEEYTITSKQLNEILLMPGSEKHVQMRMERNLRNKAANYECPTHGDALVLHRKKEAQGLLDAYHLRCSRWKGFSHVDSCNFTLKLKSAGQLAQVLKQFEGRGIL